MQVWDNSYNQTSKGSQEGSGGRTAFLFVAIAHNKGVILGEQYERHMNGHKFADFVREQFPTLFENSCNKKGKLLLQDGDPSQNSRKAKLALTVCCWREKVYYSYMLAVQTWIPLKTFFIMHVKWQLHEIYNSKKISVHPYTQANVIGHHH